MNIARVHLDALKALGLHRRGSSFSLPRSDTFGLFCGASIPRVRQRPLGGAHNHLLEQTSHKKHARTETFPKSGIVYHLFSRRLYRQIDRENLRNRRQHEIEYIQRRIGILDFVLFQPTIQVLETEPQKVSFSAIS